MTVPNSENEESLNRIRGQIGAIVEDYGAELVDVELVGSRNQPTLRIFLHKHPSVELKLCAKISREIADFLDIEDPLTGRYRLEVTSPGLDRPLMTNSDFSRAQDHILKIVNNNGRTYKGRLKEWDDTTLFIETRKSTIEQIKRLEIAKATIEVEFKKRG
ncbi:MAG: ribosome maturation factor RimP [Candidatus Latescibacterota bacterium]|nr:ribosome maturation factor RimP [Candidatus Latescibacterota bacterium]